MRRLDALAARRTDASVRASLAGEIYKTMRESESVRYTIGAMQPIDPEYTKNTFAQGDRVRGQLKERMADSLEFEYQGSTTTDTHIRAKSDIDLLMIQGRWISLQSPQVPQVRYTGNCGEEMRGLRTRAVTALHAAFPQVTVNNTNSTAIKLTGGSLTRDIDVVPASWYHTNEFARCGDSDHKGVEVFNQETGQFIPNTPRLHKREIEARDQATRGGLRKAARLMKSLMYDSDGAIKMSSYNIVGIAFNIPKEDLTHEAPRELVILEACHQFCKDLEWNTANRGLIRVPDGHRCVFGEKPGASIEELSALSAALTELRNDVLRENNRSFARLAEARVDHPLAPSLGW